MSAPLTPRDPKSPDSSPHPAPESSDGEPSVQKSTFGHELKRGALTAVAVAVCGVALGLLWLWLAPRVPLISDGKAVYLEDSEGEQAAGADSTFILIGLGLGLLAGAVVFWRARSGGIAVVLGLAAGALAGSVIGWRVGVWLGPTTNLVAHAKAVGVNKVFDGPLQLGAKGGLLAWPIGATLTYLALISAFGPRDPEVLPHWDLPEPPRPPVLPQDPAHPPVEPGTP